MSLGFKYNSVKLPWNSFYRHTSISDSSSFFHIGGGVKRYFYQSFAGFPSFFSDTTLRMKASLACTFSKPCSLLSILWHFIVFHIQIHDSCWTWAKYFSSFLWQGFQQMSYWPDLLKRHLNSHLHTDTHVVNAHLARGLCRGAAKNL